MKRKTNRLRKPAKKAGARRSFSEQGWLAQIKEFQKVKNPDFYWGSELLMKMAKPEGQDQKRSLAALLDRRLKELAEAGNSEALRAVVGSFIAYGQEDLIRSTLRSLELYEWAGRVPKKGRG